MLQRLLLNLLIGFLNLLLGILGFRWRNFANDLILIIHEKTWLIEILNDLTWNVIQTHLILLWLIDKISTLVIILNPVIEQHELILIWPSIDLLPNRPGIVSCCIYLLLVLVGLCLLPTGLGIALNLLSLSIFIGPFVAQNLFPLELLQNILVILRFRIQNIGWIGFISRLLMRIASVNLIYRMTSLEFIILFIGQIGIVRANQLLLRHFIF